MRDSIRGGLKDKRNMNKRKVKLRSNDHRAAALVASTAPVDSLQEK